MEPFKTISALALTFGLLGGFIWLFRSLSLGKGGRAIPWNRKAHEQRLKSVEKLTLGPDCALHLIALDGEAMLLAVSSKAVIPLHTLASRPKTFHTVGGAL